MPRPLGRALVRLTVPVTICLGAACAGTRREPPVAPADAARERTEAYRVMPVGLCEDYPEEARTRSAALRDLGLLRSHGITHLRISLGWDGIETTPGVFDWAWWDWFIPAAAEEHGITLIPYVCYTPDWAASPGDGGDDAPPTYTRPPRDLDAFRRFVAAAAERYEPWIDSWEIWNEPDNPAYWTGTRGEYAELLKSGAAGVRAGDPNARVVMGGLAWDVSWIGELFDDPAVVEAVDVVNLHSYLETWSGEPAESIATDVLRARDLIADEGAGEPLWVAEVGYSTLRSAPGDADLHTPRWSYERTPEYQAQHLLKTVAMLAATGEVDLVAWYEIRDLPAGEDVIGDEHNRHLGVIDVHGRPKPAFQALLLARDLFQVAPFRSLDRETRVERPLASDAVVHVFEQRDGRVVVVAWLRAVAHGAATGNEAGSEEDTRQERITVTLPLPAGSAIELDARGRPLGEPGVLGAPGLTIIPLELRGGRVRIVILEPAPPTVGR